MQFVMRQWTLWAARLAAQVRPGARLVLIEFREGDLPQGPPEDVEIPRAEIVRPVTDAGFDLEAARTDLMPYQLFLSFRRRAPAQEGPAS